MKLCHRVDASSNWLHIRVLAQHLFAPRWLIFTVGGTLWFSVVCSKAWLKANACEIALRRVHVYASMCTRPCVLNK